MKKKAVVITLLTLLLCSIALTIYIYIIDQTFNNIIIPGIYINNIDVAGLNFDEAKMKLIKEFKQKLHTHYILKFGDKEWYLPTTNAILVEVDEILDYALNIAKGNNFIKNFLERKKIKEDPLFLEPIIKLNENGIEPIVRDIASVVFSEPRNAFFEIRGDNIIINKEVNGTALNESKLKEEIIKKVWEGNKNIDIPIIETKPQVTEEILSAMNITAKIGEFSTRFNKELKERTENIKLAAEILNGHVIAPGEVFSFNEVVGERTGEKGYKEAPIFVNNETVPGIGGGICQLSSTLYNVALLLDLEIVERSNHSLPVSYVPLGRDATVNYNTIDFKFKNITHGHLLIHCEVEDDTLKVCIFGNEKWDKNIELHTEIVKTIPPPVRTVKDYNLEVGKTKFKQGANGYQVKLYKISGNNDEKKRSLVSIDTYNPVPSVLYVGEKPPEKEIAQISDSIEYDTTTSLDESKKSVD